MSTSDLCSESRFVQGRLLVEGVPVEDIGRALGTPVYVYSGGAIRARYRALAGAFSGRDALICYALKANPNRAVCRVLAREGAGAEVVSGGELKRALAAGFAAERIVFSGVGKTEAEHELAVRAGVLTLNVESEEELDALSAVARRLKRRAPVSIRVNPGVDAGGHRHIATGHGEAKFGVDAASALVLSRRAWRDPHLAFRGLHCHIGSQILSAAPYLRALAVLERLLARLRALGARPSLLDLGGGLGIPYGDGARRDGLEPAAFARKLLPALAAWPELKLILEPGRYLVGEAGLLLTRILYRKRIGGSRFIVVDAAMNDLARPALYGAYHPVVPARLREAPEVVADVVGPVCETGDVLARARRLPWLPRGELLAVLKTGAYGFSMASQYNSRPRPPEALVEGARWRVVRRREGFADLVRHER
ncbi:MAG: diaminopimelate decarboxylase [Elusimicrobia bacterium]|nr:diaminopimelate decarboxylase [Elusimicrobiota bacterium]